MTETNTLWQQRGESLIASAGVLLDMSAQKACSALVTTSHYAVQKRVLVPAWWVLAWAQSALSSDFSLGIALSGDEMMLQGMEIHPKYFLAIALIWNELFRIQADGKGDFREVEVPLDKIIRGTSAELSEQVVVIEQFFSSP